MSTQVEGRRELEARLYVQEGWSMTAIAQHVGVSYPTVRYDLQRLGIPPRKAAPPKKHVPAKPRSCANCGKAFTPPDHKPWRKYCDRGCSDEGRAASPTAALMTRAERAERVYALYVLERVTYREIEKLTGISAMTARADLLGRGNKSRGVERRPWVYRTFVECACGCGRTRWVYSSDLDDGTAPRFVTPTCWGSYRWKHGIELEKFVKVTFPGRPRSKWLGRWKGQQAGHLGGRPRGSKASEAQIRTIRLLRERDPAIGRIRLARAAQLSEKQVRTILANLKE